MEDCEHTDLTSADSESIGTLCTDCSGDLLVELVEVEDGVDNTRRGEASHGQIGMLQAEPGYWKGK